MLYTQGTWTSPASHNTTQARWDLAMLSPVEYQEKYNLTPEQYEQIRNGVVAVEEEK